MRAPSEIRAVCARGGEARTALPAEGRRERLPLISSKLNVAFVTFDVTCKVNY